MKKVFMLLLLFLCIFAPAVAENRKPLNILVIHSYHQTLPWTMEFQQGLENADLRFGEITYFFEYMETSRLDTPLRDEEFADYLKYKYRSVKLDAILGESDSACLFLDKYRNLFDNIPHVYYTKLFLPSNSDTFSFQSEFYLAVKETLKIAMKQNPDAKEVFLITETNLENSFIEKSLLFLAPDYNGLKVTRIRDFTFSELLETVKKLPPKSIIFYYPSLHDREGNFRVPREFLTELAAISDARIYPMLSALLGSGALGGYMIDTELLAEEMIRAVTDYYRTGRFGNDYIMLKTVFDLSAMNRKGISRRTLPKNTELVNKPEPLIIRYLKEFLIIIAVIMSGLLITALHSLSMVRKKNKALTDTNTQLKRAKKIAEHLSVTDPLTGLSNRRAAMSLITYEMNKQKRSSYPVSLMIIDLDHFKNVNDELGHDTGDLVLQKTAEIFSSSIRETDIIARWGGEEFLIICPDTPGINTVALADKIREKISSFTFPADCRMTVSIGVAEHEKQEDFNKWFARADSALYKAKHKGRNSVILAGSSPSDESQNFDEKNILLFHLQWKKEYSSGNRQIDDAHRTMFDIANILINSIHAKKEEGLDYLFSFLTETVEKHIYEETKLLKKIDFPNIEDHIQEHQKLLAELQNKISQFMNKEISEYDLLKFICHELMLEHMLERDKLFFEYLK